MSDDEILIRFNDDEPHATTCPPRLTEPLDELVQQLNDAGVLATRDHPEHELVVTFASGRSFAIDPRHDELLIEEIALGDTPA